MRCDPSRPIIRIRSTAKMQGGYVMFIQTDEAGKFARGFAADAYDQKTARERIERAGMADGSFAGNMPYPVDDIVRSRADGLVY